MTLSSPFLQGSAEKPTQDPTAQEETQAEKTTEPTTPADQKLLPEGTTEVTLAVGESVQVSLGMGNMSVGDDWGVVKNSDEGVAQAEVVRG